MKIAATFTGCPHELSGTIFQCWMLKSPCFNRRTEYAPENVRELSL